ncbi:MAG: RNA polymerase sigma factor [Phycisphaerae bacterium]|nr:RNA polymerase sigma factor [Phycisphaerae bacterium]
MDRTIADLIEGASSGDQQCMEALIPRIQPRVRAHIMRCTLNHDLADDVLQETMLQMITSLPSLRNHDRFWPWIYRIASNKVATHFRKLKRQPEVAFSTLEAHLLESALKDESVDAMEGPVIKELSGIVMRAVEKLTARQREILSLRCFESLPHAQIAEIVGCTELVARVQYLRICSRLKSTLKTQGITGSSVLLSLVLFGKFTADKTLAASISQTSILFDTGMTALKTGSWIAKGRVFRVSAVAALLLICLLIARGIQPPPLPTRAQVKSVHFVSQGVTPTGDEQSRPSTDSEFMAGPYAFKAQYEKWLRFPEGPDGPVQFRMQRWNIDMTEKACGWLQDGTLNCYYNCVENTVYLTNEPLPLFILPVDPPETAQFSLDHLAYKDDLVLLHDSKTGLLKAEIDNRVETIKDYSTRYEYNKVSEDDFKPFWPADANIVDQRDPMHRRGWTYFTIEGTIGDVAVSGQGQMPLVPSAYADHKPWLTMAVGHTVQLMDTGEAAWVTDLASGETTRYPGGTFFTGLGRPWLGMCAYDTLRRDAAKNRIAFGFSRQDNRATVTLHKESGYTNNQLVYDVNLSADVVETIRFSHSGKENCEGDLVFAYAQALEDWPDKHEMPKLPKWPDGKPYQRMEYWPFWLLEQVPAWTQAVVVH